jgi:hypothetical protein
MFDKWHADPGIGWMRMFLLIHMRTVVIVTRREGIGNEMTATHSAVRAPLPLLVDRQNRQFAKTLIHHLSLKLSLH